MFLYHAPLSLFQDFFLHVPFEFDHECALKSYTQDLMREVLYKWNRGQEHHKVTPIPEKFSINELWMLDEAL